MMLLSVLCRVNHPINAREMVADDGGNMGVCEPPRDKWAPSFMAEPLTLVYWQLKAPSSERSDDFIIIII